MHIFEEDNHLWAPNSLIGTSISWGDNYNIQTLVRYGFWILGSFPLSAFGIMLNVSFILHLWALFMNECNYGISS